MATTASTFRRPKNKGGTKSSIGADEGQGRGMRRYHSGESRNDYRKAGLHKGLVEVSHHDFLFGGLTASLQLLK